MTLPNPQVSSTCSNWVGSFTRSNTGNKLPSDAYRKILPKTPESPSVPYIPCQDKQSLGISVSSGAIIFYSVSMVPLEALQLMGLFDIINITKEVTT